MLTGPAVFHTQPKVKKLVVIFHGYGADGNNLLDLALTWAPYFPETDFMLPNGPEICRVNRAGFQWFGLQDFLPATIRAGLDHVRPPVISYLYNQLEQRNLTTKDLVLVGFSQGGMVALDMMFCLSGLRGILGYSSAFYLPLGSAALPVANPQVLLVHGALDTVIPSQAMQESDRQLQLCGIKAKTYLLPHLAHSIDEEGIKLGQKFLHQMLDDEESIDD